VLSSWKDSHKEKVEGITEKYDALAKEGFHRGAFQSIESQKNMHSKHIHLYF